MKNYMANAELELTRWDVSKYSNRRTAHLWAYSPLNTDYVRSRCGLVEAKRNLQGLHTSIGVCKKCGRLVGSSV